MTHSAFGLVCLHYFYSENAISGARPRNTFAFELSMNAPPSPNLTASRLPVVTPSLKSKAPRIVDLPNKRTNSIINDLTIQVAVLNAACEFMGTDMWKYSKNSGKSYHQRPELLQAVRDASGFMLSYRTLMRWIDYYQKYGEAPAKARRNRRPTVRQLYKAKRKVFSLNAMKWN